MAQNANVKTQTITNKNKSKKLGFNGVLNGIMASSIVLLASFALVVVLLLVTMWISASTGSGWPIGIALAISLIFGLMGGASLITWVVFTIIALVKVENEKDINVKVFRIVFGILLGVVTASSLGNMISNIVSQYTTIPTWVQEFIQWLGGLQSTSLVGSIVMTAVFKHQITNPANKG